MYVVTGGVYTYSKMFGVTRVTKVKCMNGQSFGWSPNQQIPKEFYPKEVKYCGSKSTNTRWLDELHFPVLKREEK